MVRGIMKERMIVVAMRAGSMPPWDHTIPVKLVGVSAAFQEDANDLNFTPGGSGVKGTQAVVIP